MPVRTEHWPAGTPCWVDLVVTDPERSHRFYGGALGWTFTEPAPEFGGYHSALAGGVRVAGLSLPQPGWTDAPRWGVYLATDDVDATSAAVTAAGGSAVGGTARVGDLGRMAHCQDPTGAAFSAWEAGTHPGFELVDEPGAPLWMDLMTTDLDAAQRFYADVFGLSYTDASSDAMRYSMFNTPGGTRPAGGIGQLDASPSTWTVCFQVADVDELVPRIPDLGGRVVDEPFDFTWGRLAGVLGPDGERLYLLTPGG
ncbi:MAG: VOC family protein [Propionicimonas sp.]|uniref:VOC family protein n=1 Tax=Propionicimonas sp. TaxID=1955623 RepID=UPI003D10FFBE